MFHKGGPEEATENLWVAATKGGGPGKGVESQKLSADYALLIVDLL